MKHPWVGDGESTYLQQILTGAHDGEVLLLLGRRHRPHHFISGLLFSLDLFVDVSDSFLQTAEKKHTNTTKSVLLAFFYQNNTKSSEGILEKWSENVDNGTDDDIVVNLCSPHVFQFALFIKLVKKLLQPQTRCGFTTREQRADGDKWLAGCKRSCQVLRGQRVSVFSPGWITATGRLKFIMAEEAPVSVLILQFHTDWECRGVVFLTIFKQG